MKKFWLCLMALALIIAIVCFCRAFTVSPCDMYLVMVGTVMPSLGAAWLFSYLYKIS